MKKKRRRSRWSSGLFSKRKSYITRYHAHLRYDVEEVEKGGTECEDGTGGEEDQMVVGVEPTAQDGRSEPNVKEQEREERSQAAEETGEADDQTQKETDQPGQSDEKSETTSINTNKERHTEARGDTQGESNTKESGETETVTPTGDRNNKVVTVKVVKSCSSAEPMEVEAADTSTAAVRGDEDAGTERTTRRLTRSQKNAELQPPIQETPPLVVDRDQLKVLLDRVVTKTEGYEVYQLEKLYALLCQSIYRHRRDYNKTSLLQELEQEIEDFCQFSTGK